MSTPKVFTDAPRVYSGREKVLAERDAFLRGVTEGIAAVSPLCGPWTSEMRAKRAVILFPLPKVTRPRVVRAPSESGGSMRFNFRIGPKGALEWADTENWSEYGDVSSNLDGSAAFAAMWADLIANPTEEVNDDGSST